MHVGLKGLSIQAYVSHEYLKYASAFEHMHVILNIWSTRQ